MTESTDGSDGPRPAEVRPEQSDLEAPDASRLSLHEVAEALRQLFEVDAENPSTEVLTTAWTPEGSVGTLGSVLLKRRLEDLNYIQYRFALADRIDRLIEKEPPERARALLEVFEREEPLSLRSVSLNMMGEFLAENSEALCLASGRSGFPVPSARLEHEPETEEVLREETLEEFLDKLFGWYRW